MYGEIIPIYCKSHTGHTKTVCGQITELVVLKLAEHDAY